MNNNKKYIIVGILIIIVILIVVYGVKVIDKENTLNKEKENIFVAEKVESDNEFVAYSLNNIKVNDSNANLIFLDDFDGTGQEEIYVKVGDTYSFDGKIGEKYTIKVLEINNDYMVISIDKGLAPRKKTGGFSLRDEYDKITIKKNTGICLNEQVTDLRDASVYFFYIN